MELPAESEASDTSGSPPDSPHSLDPTHLQPQASPSPERRQTPLPELKQVPAVTSVPISSPKAKKRTALKKLWRKVSGPSFTSHQREPKVSKAPKAEAVAEEKESSSSKDGEKPEADVLRFPVPPSIRRAGSLPSMKPQPGMLPPPPPPPGINDICGSQIQRRPSSRSSSPGASMLEVALPKLSLSAPDLILDDSPVDPILGLAAFEGENAAGAPLLGYGGGSLSRRRARPLSRVVE